jgi:hypothetical protein
MIADRLHHLLPAMNHIEYPGRQPRFRQQLRYANSTERHQLGWLEHQAVAQRDGVGNGPVRHHAGEVEWNDGGDDSHGIPVDPAFHSAAHLQHLTGDDLGERAGELGQLDGLQYFGLSLARNLAVLFRDQGGQAR